MFNWLKKIGHWCDARLGFSDTLMPMMRHPVPRAIEGPLGWWYVFGSASLTMFLIQIVTGIGLALVYVPAADKAYESLLYLNYQQPLGWFLRSLHYYAGSGMVVMMLVHMTQVFLHGAYKYPRELTWVLGVFLLICTMGMFFTGQVLRWDPDAYWGLAVGGSMAGRVPVIGPWIVHLLLGGEIIGGDSLSRFFALHVFVIPGALIAFLAAHLWLVIKCGVSVPPVAGQVVDPSTYDATYHEELKRGVPFLGDAILKDILFSSLAVIAVVAIAAILGPKGPTGPPDPTLAGANPRPEWPFLWLFGLLSLSPPGIETFIMLVFPVLVIGDSVFGAICQQSWRTSTQSPAGGGAVRDRRIYGARRAHVRGNDGAVVAENDRLERRSGSRELCEAPLASRVARCAGVPIQKLPQLPCAGRNRRAARTRSERHRHTNDCQSIDRSSQ